MQHTAYSAPDKFEQDKDFQDQTIESLVIEIERLENDEKIVVLSRLFLALMENQINWKRFRDLCGVLERVHLLALEYLSTQTPSTINRIRIDHKMRASHTPIPCDLQEALLLEASGLGLRSETIVDNSRIIILTAIGRELVVFWHPSSQINTNRKSCGMTIQMEDAIKLVVIPLILSIVGGVVVAIVEYWVIQPIRQGVNKDNESSKPFNQQTAPQISTQRTNQGRTTTKQTAINTTIPKNKDNTSIFSLLGIYPFNLNRVMISLIIFSSLFLTAATVSFERAPEKFLGLMAISGLLCSLAGCLSFYIDRDYFGYVKSPLWQKVLVVVITIFALFFMPFCALIAIYILLGVNY